MLVGRVAIGREMAAAAIVEETTGVGVEEMEEMGEGWAETSGMIGGMTGGEGEVLPTATTTTGGGKGRRRGF